MIAGQEGAGQSRGGEGQAGGEVPQEQQHIKIYSNKTFHLKAGVR